MVFSMKRIDIKVGFSCNNNCLFCAQGHKKSFGDRSTIEIERDLSSSKIRCGGVVFTGGEFTIRKDAFELVSYAKVLGFSVIQIQSNGRMFSNKAFCKKIINCGANQFALALHGHTPDIHENLTRAKGSFNQTVRGIKNLKELSQTVLMNTVVNLQNYKHLPELAHLFVDLGVDQFQFAFIHPIGTGYKYFDEMVPRISDAAPYIHQGLQIGIDAGISVMAEAMPFCLMNGYEKYVSELRIPVTEVSDVDSYVLDYLQQKKNEGKMKFKKCFACNFNKICEGPWKEYPERFGDYEFNPIKKSK